VLRLFATSTRISGSAKPGYLSPLDLRAIYNRVTAPFVNLARPVPKRLKILTFNCHEGYNYELAKTGHSFDLVLPSRGLWPSEWDVRSRPLPPNVRVVGRLPEWSLRDLSGYDLIVAQTLEQFELIEFHPSPKLLLLHTSVSVEETEWPSVEAMYRINNVNLRRRLHAVPTVFVSEYARQGWGLPGRVIEIGFDILDYLPFLWQGDVKKVLTVSHFFQERARDTGFHLHRRIVGDDIPFKIVGHNPHLASSGPATSWDELRRYYQSHAVYLDPSGGSMAGLEAAAVGMPLVKIRRSTGHHIFTDGYDAFLSDDPQRLRSDILRLLRDRDLAEAMGERARRTVSQVWGIERFVSMWQDAFADAIRIPHAPPPRVTVSSDRDFFLGDVSADAVPQGLAAGQLAWAKVRVRNLGTGLWCCYTHERVAEVRLSYHWLTSTSDPVVWDGVRTPLLADLHPGEETQLDAAFRVPDSAGMYLLEWDLVCEHVAWFSTRGNPTARVPIAVFDRVS
jgi:glycosyltransferase involved in cell wall biosynthesis